MKELENKGLVLFDGVCQFCNSSVNFMIRKDNTDYFRFLPLQSELGQKIIKQFNLDPENLQTVILLENKRIYTRSTAALRIAKKLKGGWKLFYGFVIIPAFIRDAVYNVVARNRYKWWGKRDSCMVPTPDVKKKFL
ncbi:MAG TPA: DCC1-like thiol-disulfide oxidoreductase family protein [Bacteroidia bacterium]|nr:DCC1-like thiol-disulfide oxidoreductase family protein [Bacteroidia bacterium]